MLPGAALPGRTYTPISNDYVQCSSCHSRSTESSSKINKDSAVPAGSTNAASSRQTEGDVGIVNRMIAELQNAKTKASFHKILRIRPMSSKYRSVSRCSWTRLISYARRSQES